MPRFKLETIEDAYTYYVLIVGISEDLFWTSEWSDLMTIMENKTAYDNWMAYVRQKMNERS